MYACTYVQHQVMNGMAISVSSIFAHSLVCPDIYVRSKKVQPVRVWLLEIALVCVSVSVYVCVSTPEAINN